MTDGAANQPTGAQPCGYANTAAASLYPANANVFDLGHAQGALTGYVHPFDEMPNPEDKVPRVTRELPSDAALVKCDYLECHGFRAPISRDAVWYGRARRRP